MIEMKNIFSILLESWMVNENVPNKLWKEIKSVFTEAAEKKFGRRTKKSVKPFISNEYSS